MRWIVATLKERLAESLKTSLKGGDKQTLMFARNLQAAIRQKEIDSRKDVDEAEFIGIVSSKIKQRQESIEQFKKGAREDLVVMEEAELKYLQSYLPPQMGADEVRQLIDQAIAEAHAAGPKDMGKVMKILMPKTQGRADGKLVSSLVSEKLKNVTSN